MLEAMISVIVASYNSRRTLGDCLQSLQNQKTSRKFEVILVDSSADDTCDWVKHKFPFVQVIHAATRKFPGEARNIGIARARGEIIALIDADCQAAEDWIEQIAMAHEYPWPAIGGTIGNANPESYVGWAAYLCEFSQWMPGTKAGYHSDIAAANMSYKQAVIDAFGPFMTGGYCSDTHFHWRLAAGGQQLRFVPAIRVVHHNITKFESFIRHEYFHGQSFARMRLRFRRFSRLKRSLYVALSPLIPIKLLLKTASICFRNERYRTEFVKSAPLLVLGILSWSFGEFSVYAGLVGLETR